MQNAKCPHCGHEAAPDILCAGCGHASANGTVKKSWSKPAPPPEAVNWVVERVPQEVREEFLRTFNETEYLAEAREALATGGADIDALIAELERMVFSEAVAVTARTSG